MVRLAEQSATIREVYPAEYTEVAVFITDLGGSTLLMFVLALCYWLTRRRESLLVVSYAVAGVSFILLLKTLLAMPRPPSEVHLVALSDDPYGFPSGHAFAAVIVYGGLLSAFERTRQWPAVAAVAILVTLISLSRIVLGFHYLGDTIVGALLGIGFVLAMNRLTRGDPQRGFIIGLVLAVPALILIGGTGDILLAFGGALGGIAGSRVLESLPALRSRLEGGVLAVIGCGFVFSMMLVESAVTALESTMVVTPALLGIYAVLIFGLIYAPAAVGRLEVGALSRSTTVSE